ncbi:autotransporter-associated beta strand repeat-containing protein [Roseimicrobium sp. ORNL1]|uniref:beta strand repeat-containing protein n=1 Tax=Roseimicrobium sp. ORNL1 TaxID=2711231 RepID=UPI0013E1E5C5|nr:autotransporter-associated beta strand repeat-containing protein [Roseimicrobium sp. ORNL1]QIF03201.1 PEP-CTERM sorting domain-containing protein [Roseimicrobium sp. ORNL1]
MRFFNLKVFRHLPLVATALLIHGSAIQSVMGANLVWDTVTGNSTVEDGIGTWTGTGGNWYNETTPTQDQPWSNSAGHIAVFGAGGTPGTVTVSGTVNANGLIFRDVAAGTSYTLQGGTIALAAGSKISLGNNTSNATNRVNLNSTISGSNITIEKTAGSTQLALVNLGSTQSLSGKLSLVSADTGGLFVQANAPGSLPSASLTMVDVGTNVTLVLGTAGTYAVPFTLNGSGASSRGAIRFETGITTLTGAITLAGNTTITHNTFATSSIINSNIGESGGAFTLKLATQGTPASTAVIALGGNNTFTGGLIIEVSNVRIDHDGALNSTAPNLVTFTSTTSAHALLLNGHSVTISGLQGLGSTVAVKNENATAATLTIQSTSDRTFAGVLADGTGGGALSVVKSGTSAQTLSGANTFTGGLTLNAGTLNINSASALGATASVFTINGGTLGNTTAGAITNANNNAMVWNGDFTFSAAAVNTLNLGTGAVSLGTAAGTSRTITVSSNALTTLTVGGSISDGTTANGITKAGAGILVLGGNSTYTGLTSVNAGILRITHGNALGSAAAGTTVAAGNRLQLANNITVNGEHLITPYLENVSGDNTWNGTIQCAVGSPLTLDAAGGNLLITGNVNAKDTANGNHTTHLIGSGTGEISGVLSNTLTVNKAGTGTWIFSGANTYTDVTNVNAGGLQVGKNGVGQTGTGAVAVKSGAKLFGTGVVRGSAVTLESGAFLYGGDGTANNNHGTLTFNPGGAAAHTLASGSLVTLSLGGATLNDASFGGNTVGTAGYNNWVDSISNAGTHDRLVFDGTSGTLTISSNMLVVTDGYVLKLGDAFNLLDWSLALSTSFSGFNVGSNYRTGADDNGLQFDLPDISALGYFWDVSRFTNSGVILVVPEPGRMLLLGVGLGLLTMRRRRSSR